MHYQVQAKQADIALEMSETEPGKAMLETKANQFFIAQVDPVTGDEMELTHQEVADLLNQYASAEFQVFKTAPGVPPLPLVSQPLCNMKDLQLMNIVDQVEYTVGDMVARVKFKR